MGLIAEFLDPFERMLADLSPPEVVREIEEGGETGPLWQSIIESGFLDALVPEEKDGAGLTLSEVGALAQALGRQLVPLPIAQTIVGRALLADAGIASPGGPIVLISPARHGNGCRAASVPLAIVAEHALVDLGDHLVLVGLESSQIVPSGIYRSESADIVWPDNPVGQFLPRPSTGLRGIAATLRAAEIAGACERLLEMTIEYAGQRVQFGRPIARQQAIQHQLSIMAEQTVMARMAAEIGCVSGFPPTLLATATAKQVASSAASQIAAIAHAVHGAIGFSEELDLQLYTRRLYEWRMADGSEGYWAGILGRERLASKAATSIDFIREEY